MRTWAVCKGNDSFKLKYALLIIYIVVWTTVGATAAVAFTHGDGELFLCTAFISSPFGLSTAMLRICTDQPRYLILKRRLSMVKRRDVW
jgi:hypothetical protein